MSVAKSSQLWAGLTTLAHSVARQLETHDLWQEQTKAACSRFCSEERYAGTREVVEQNGCKVQLM